MPWIGFLLGALIGAYLHGFKGFIAGAAVGLVIGVVLRKSPLAGEPATSRRIVALELRVAALEAELARSPAPPTAATAGSSAPAAGVARGETPVAELVVAPIAGAPSDVVAAPRSPVRKGGAGAPGAVGVAYAASSVSRPASARLADPKAARKSCCGPPSPWTTTVKPPTRPCAAASRAAR